MQDFARAMEAIVSDPARAQQIGVAGRKHVKAAFSREVFADQLNAVMESAAGGSTQLRTLRNKNSQFALWCILLVIILVVLLMVVVISAIGVSFYNDQPLVDTFASMSDMASRLVWSPVKNMFAK